MRLRWDPLLRVRVRGYPVDVRVGSLVVLGVVVGGSVAQRTGASGSQGGLPRLVAASLIAATALIAFQVGSEAIRYAVERRVGVATWGSHGYLFGGVARVTIELPPRTDALIGLTTGGALAVLGGCVIGVAWVVGQGSGVVADAAATVLIGVGAMLLLQAMPAAPLAGGRVFRAWLRYLNDDAIGVATAAAFCAQLVAAGVVATGVLLLTREPTFAFWGLWAIVAGAEVAGAARADRDAMIRSRAHRGVTLGQFSQGTERRMNDVVTIDDALGRMLDAGTDAAFLVVGASGEALGVLQAANLRRFRRTEWDRRTIADVMTPLATVPRLERDLSVADALERMDRSRHALVVVERDDQTVAVITRALLVGRSPDRPTTAATAVGADEPTH